MTDSRLTAKKWWEKVEAAKEALRALMWEAHFLQTDARSISSNVCTTDGDPREEAAAQVSLVPDQNRWSAMERHARELEELTSGLVDELHGAGIQVDFVRRLARSGGAQ